MTGRATQRAQWLQEPHRDLHCRDAALRDSASARSSRPHLPVMVIKHLALLEPSRSSMFVNLARDIEPAKPFASAFRLELFQQVEDEIDARREETSLFGVALAETI